MKNKGFTLVELLLVIVLIGIILVLAVPSLRDTLTGNDLKKSTRLLIGLERKLRAEAVRDQIDYLLCFDLSTASYWVTASDMTSEKQNEMKKQMKQLPAGVKILDIVDDKGKKSSETEVRIKFGKNNVCAPTVIHLGSDEDKMTIVINPFLGITDIYDKYIDIEKIATERDMPGFRKTL
ncbi:MAG: prepilin-type N-terminal cleavage/methylation domain-containing protein [Smithella sp.]